MGFWVGKEMFFLISQNFYIIFNISGYPNTNLEWKSVVPGANGANTIALALFENLTEVLL
jgi:hypothetical protein